MGIDGQPARDPRKIRELAGRQAASVSAAATGCAAAFAGRAVRPEEDRAGVAGVKQLATRAEFGHMRIRTYERTNVRHRLWPGQADAARA